MKSCDICNKKTETFAYIYEHFKTEEIKDICIQCDKELEPSFDKIKELLRKIDSVMFETQVSCFKRVIDSLKKIKGA